MGEGVDEQKRTTLRQFAALGAAGPLARFLDGDGGTSDARDAIAGYVAQAPGTHFSAIRDDLGLATGETQHHLNRLKAEDAIETHRDGDYRRFFPAGTYTEFEQVALGYLRRKTPREMVLALLADSEASASDLAVQAGVSRPTVSKYAAELERAGLLSRTDGYALTDPETLFTLVVRHADSFDTDTVAFAAQAHGLIRMDQ